MPLSCGLCHKRISALQGLNIVVATHNCGISSKPRVHSPGNTPCISPHKPPPYNPIIQHSPCLPDIQTPFLQAVLHGINPPLPQGTTTSTLSYIEPLSNFVILHSLYMAEPSQALSSSIYTTASIPFTETGTSLKPVAFIKELDSTRNFPLSCHFTATFHSTFTQFI